MVFSLMVFKYVSVLELFRGFVEIEIVIVFLFRSFWICRFEVGSGFCIDNKFLGDVDIGLDIIFWELLFLSVEGCVWENYEKCKFLVYLKRKV